MSTIVDFRRRREEAADARLLSGAGESAPLRTLIPHSGEHIAEIIVFPRQHREPRKPRRKTLKRRFAPKPAMSAMP